MVISIKEKSRSMKIINEALDSPQRSVPEYLSADKAHYSGQLLARPLHEQMPWPIEISLPVICDFLAHTT
jgi:small subunit ribosomal protein S4